MVFDRNQLLHRAQLLAKQVAGDLGGFLAPCNPDAKEEHPAQHNTHCRKFQKQVLPRLSFFTS